MAERTLLTFQTRSLANTNPPGHPTPQGQARTRSQAHPTTDSCFLDMNGTKDSLNLSNQELSQHQPLFPFPRCKWQKGFHLPVETAANPTPKYIGVPQNLIQTFFFGIEYDASVCVVVSQLNCQNHFIAKAPHNPLLNRPFNFLSHEHY